MIPTEQIEAIRKFGYSPKEAEFVAAAALHSGYFLARQFKNDRGQAVHNLCRKVTAYNHADHATFARRTRLYHIFSKPIYAALGQEDNRHRKAKDSYQIRAKLMGFDYVQSNPEYRYLPTEQDKLDFFSGELGLSLDVLPQKKYFGESKESTTRYFVDKYPIRIDPQTKRVGFCYVDTALFSDLSFLTWLNQYEPLIRALDSADIVYVADSTAPLKKAKTVFEKRFGAIQTGAGSQELARYFADRLSIETQGPAGRTQEQLNQYRALNRRYAAPAFQEQYAAWKAGQLLPEDAPKVTFSTVVLPFTYSWLGSASVATK